MEEVRKYLKNTLNKDDKIVVGCSGGPDSMCLLHVLISLKEELSLSIVCAHVNHGLRDESKEELEFVKKYCENNNVIFESMEIKSYKNNKFSESEAHDKRYEYFEELIKKYNAKYLMTAHHGDDLVETILMKLVRGSNLDNYIGIKKVIDKKYYHIIRPLLTVDKDEILNYLKLNNIKYVIDKSNESDKYTRNRYRKNILPFLKKENINVHKKFLEFNQELEENNSYIRKIILQKENIVYKDNYINIDIFKLEDKYLQKRIIEYLISNIQEKDFLNINKVVMEDIIKLIDNNKNTSINLNNGYIARKSYNKLYIEKNINSEDYEYIFDNELIVGNFKLFRLDKSDEKSNYVTRLLSSEIKLPLIIRNKRVNDKVKLKNLGTKKLKDLFIDSKIDMKKRNIYPILVDSNNNILWIPGLKKTIFDKEKDEKYDIIIKCMEEKDE